MTRLLCEMYLKIKWSPWNPWCIGMLNLAWRKYTQTGLYVERKKVSYTPTDEFGDYAEFVYCEKEETLSYVEKFTWQETLQVIFAPFSCGDKYALPIWTIFRGG